MYFTCNSLDYENNEYMIEICYTRKLSSPSVGNFLVFHDFSNETILRLAQQEYTRLYNIAVLRRQTGTAPTYHLTT